jgi:serine/threonine protein kinase
MAKASSVTELVLRWQELRDQGRTIAAEELCADCPELLEDLRRQVQALLSMEYFLGTEPAERPKQVAEDQRQEATPPPVSGQETVGNDPGKSAPVGAGLRYRAVRFHAKGGLGEVFIAQDAELGREVALKRIQERHRGGGSSRRDFLREAEITARLEHPGVVPVHGLVQDETGQPCYAMRFIQGESLDAAIKRFHEADKAPKRDPGERSLALRELLNRFIAVCNTISYAHSRGVLHRDLKPQNIMLGKYGETLVVDWGLAKPFERSEEARAAGEETVRPSATQEAGDETHPGDVKGTPAYMSPEQACGRIDEITPASDIFALGATLYAILTGAPPFMGPNALAKARHGDFPPPRRVKPAVPRALDAICCNAMALNPAQRYATAVVLAADVEKWLADEPVSGWAEPRTDRFRRWIRRHRTFVISALAVLLVALIGSTVGLFVLAEAEEKERRAQLNAETNERAATEAEGKERASRLIAQAKEREASEQRDEARRRRDEARWNLYLGQINAVQEAWEANDAGRAEELLNALAPQLPDEKDFRGFEWHYWHRLLHPEFRMFKAHAGGVTRLAYSLDGKYLATLGADAELPKDLERRYAASELKVWDAVTGAQVYAAKLPSDGYHVAFTADSTEVVVGGWQRAPSETATRANHETPGPANRLQELRVWDVATGKELLIREGLPGSLAGAAFSPDGLKILTGSSDGLVELLDVATAKQLLAIREQLPVLDVAFSPNGNHIAAAFGNSPGPYKVKVWHASTGKELATLQLGLDKLPEVALVFSPDGKRLALSCGLVKIVEITTGKDYCILKDRLPGRVQSLVD